MPNYKLFANTGYQFINTDLDYDGDEVSDWTYPLDNTGWLMLRSAEGKALICVDTTTGPVSRGYFAENEAQIQKPAAILQVSGIDVVIEILAGADGVGMPIEVSFVLDFGNCRTMGLLVENTGVQGHQIPARPFQLTRHRPKLDFAGRLVWDQQQVYDSYIEFVSDQLPRPQVTEVVTIEPVFEEREAKGMISRMLGKTESVMIRPAETVTRYADTKLFMDISPVRFGVEAADVRSKVAAGINALTGMSSPKRYLWADEKLTAMFWHQVTMQRDENASFLPAQVSGDYFEYLYEDDRDWTELPINDPVAKPPRNPAQPRYPRRSLMTMAIYELLCQAYQQANAIEYRASTDAPARKRVLKNLVMSYPSNMTSEEKERYEIQVGKAAAIFSANHEQTDSDGSKMNALGVRMVTDEGTAGQLTYVYSGISCFGTAEQWLQTVGRKQPDGNYKARIACLDIGGGTTDLTIADYADLSPGVATNLKCDLVCLDGESIAGDDIVLRLLQKIIIPQIANDAAVGKARIKLVFESLSDGAFCAEKRRWMTALWIPLARRYFQLAEDEDQRSSFTLETVCDEIGTLESVSQRFGCAPINKISLQYDQEAFQAVVWDVMVRPLWRLSQMITSNDCDLLILTGRTTRLSQIQKLLRNYVSMPSARIIPMDHFEAGAWYPVPDPAHPGRIADPKSLVSVGAAIEHLFAGKHGLGNTRITIAKKLTKQNCFTWGIISNSKRYIDDSNKIFGPDDRYLDAVLEIIGARTHVGRRRSKHDADPVQPIYCIYIDQDYDAGPVNVTLHRYIEPETGEERLILASAEGNVGVLDEHGNKVTVSAAVGDNVRLKLQTMLSEQYFLDGDAIFDIDYSSIVTN